jgi:hypothetical protein
MSRVSVIHNILAVVRRLKMSELCITLVPCLEECLCVAQRLFILGVDLAVTLILEPHGVLSMGREEIGANLEVKLVVLLSVHADDLLESVLRDLGSCCRQGNVWFDAS